MTMLERLGVPKEEYQLGSSKVFLRKAGWLVIDQYFRTVMGNLKPLIIRLQSIYRAVKARTYAAFPELFAGRNFVAIILCQCTK